MKPQHGNTTLLVFFVFALLSASPLRAQTNFRNLGFEQSRAQNLPPGASEIVSVSLAFPGWSATIGTNSAPPINHNQMFFGTAGISIYGPQSGMIAPEGSYFVILQAGHQPAAPPGVLAASSIFQTATIPLLTQSMQFLSTPILEGIDVSFGGQSVPLVLVSTDPSGWSRWGGDFGAFAGQTGELRFTAVATPPTPALGVYLDAITFSAAPVPEPSIFALFAVGALVLAAYLLAHF